MKLWHLTLVTLLATALCSCLPEERIWWQKDGQRALIASNGSFYLAGSQDAAPIKLAALDHEASASLSSASWLPDSQGFVCTRQRKIKTWAELKTVVGKDETDLVEATVPLVAPLLQAMIRASTTATDVDALAALFPSEHKKRYRAALQRAFELDPGVIRELLLPLKDGPQIVEEIANPKSGYLVVDVCHVILSGNAVKETRVLLSSMLRIPILPKASPVHPAVALLRVGENEEQGTLEVWPLHGPSSLTVSASATGAFDWTPDGRSLVFSTWVRKPGGELQNIQRSTALREDGALLSEGLPPDQHPSADTRLLATAVMLQRPVLQSLPDGRVLFASQPLTLPMAGEPPVLESRLYLISADASAITPVPTAAGSLPADLGHFVLSPDGSRVAVVESNTDAVAVIHLQDGRMQVVSPAHPRWKCRTLPAWRSPTELTFAGLPEGSNRPAWMCWNTHGSTTVLSDKWTDAFTAKWLELAPSE